MRPAALQIEHSESGPLMESRIRRYQDFDIGGALQTLAPLSSANATKDSVKRYTERNDLAERLSATKNSV
jgi:hypothetical protein